MSDTDDRTRGQVISTMLEAGFGAPEILALLERADEQHTIDRHTAGRVYRLTHTPAAGYRVFIYDAADVPAPNVHAQTCGLQGSGVNKSCTCHVDAADPDRAPAVDVPDEFTVKATPAADTFLARDVKAGWHMAGVGTIDRISPIGNGQIAFIGAEGQRAFGRYVLVEVTRPAPVMWAAEWPYPEFTAAEFAAHYQRAAEIIEARGYYAAEFQGYADETGISVVGALKQAARERAQAADPEGLTPQIEITAANVAEELETRLAAVIYTLGLLHTRTGISDFSDQLAAWELGHYTTGPNPARSDALGLLATAAGIFAHLSDTQAEVTAPAVPE